MFGETSLILYTLIEYMIPGGSRNNESDYQNDIVKYVVKEKVWESVGTMLYRRAHHAVTLVDVDDYCKATTKP